MAPVPADAMSDLQREVAAKIASGPRGVVRGPVQMWLHSPAFARLAQGLGAHCRFGTVLPARLSELAILVTGAHWRSGYEWLGHAPLALEAGLSAGVIEAIRVGASPAFDHADEAAVHAFASELWRTGQVGDAAFGAAAALFGAQGVVDLLGILGYYGMISMTINAFGIEGTEGIPDPFAA